MTQIYATLGPACAGQEIQEKMFQAGMTGMRLNLSHTGLEESAGLLENFHKAARNAGVVPQLLIDMQGPELRVGKLEEAVELCEGERVILSSGNDSAVVDGICIPVPAAVIPVMESGDEVLLNDGKIALRVLESCKMQPKGTQQEDVQSIKVAAQVTRGGVLTSHKSVKITGKQVALPVLTEHDISNICLASEYGVTGLMQPFVQSGSDLAYVRRMLKEHGAEQVQIFAKIENRAAVANLPGIIEEADVVIIARGDLGNDMELWELPAVQKESEGACKEAGKPYIVVTQMLASMEENAVPTRAEVSDIFHAVMHGAYGVMITGESAVGKYPVEAVKYLANTAKSAEEWRKNHE